MFQMKGLNATHVNQSNKKGYIPTLSMLIFTQ